MLLISEMQTLVCSVNVARMASEFRRKRASSTDGSNQGCWLQHSSAAELFMECASPTEAHGRPVALVEVLFPFLLVPEASTLAKDPG